MCFAWLCVCVGTCMCLCVGDVLCVCDVSVCVFLYGGVLLCVLVCVVWVFCV